MADYNWCVGPFDISFNLAFSLFDLFIRWIYSDLLVYCNIEDEREEKGERERS